MEKAFAKAEELVGSIKEYVNTRIEAVKLTTAEKTSAVIASLVAGAVAAVVFIFFLGLLSIALSYKVGEWIGSTWLGFVIIAFCYFLMAIIVWMARGRIIRLPVMNAIIRQLFKKDEED